MPDLLRVTCHALPGDAANTQFASDCLRHATIGMHRAAAERGRHLVEAPRLLETSEPNGLGLVELTFAANAEGD